MSSTPAPRIRAISASQSCSRMQTAHGRRLPINKGLHTKADAVHSLPQQLSQRLLSKLSRRALQRDLGISRQAELTPQTLKYLAKLRPSQQAGVPPPK